MSIMKYLYFIITAVAVTYLTTYIPIDGLQLFHASCHSSLNRGLPFSFLNVYIVGPYTPITGCWAPPVGLYVILAPILLDIIFWYFILLLSTKLYKKFRR